MPSRSKNNYGLTVLCPIREDKAVDEPPLVALNKCLAGLPSGHASPFAQLPMVHFARWAIVRDLPYVSHGVNRQEPKSRPDSLQSNYLMFTADVDGGRDDFLDAMALTMTHVVNAVWCHCAGFPGAVPTVDFRAYIKACELATTFFFADYPGVSVRDVHQALKWQRELIRFHATHQASTPAELQAAFSQLIRNLRGP